MSKRGTLAAKQKEDALLRIQDAALRLLLMKKKDRSKADARSIKTVAQKMGQMLKACEDGVRLNMGKRDLPSKDEGDLEED